MATVNDISSYAEEDAHCIRKLYHIFLSFFSSVYSPSGRRGARIQAPSLRGRPRLLSRRSRGARGRRLRVSDSPARRPSTSCDPHRSACAPVFGRVDARGGVRRYYRYSLQVGIRLLWTSLKLCTLLGLPWTPHRPARSEARPWHVHGRRPSCVPRFWRYRGSSIRPSPEQQICVVGRWT